MAKILLEVEIAADGAVKGLQSLDSQLRAVGTTNTQAATEVSRHEKELKRLLDRLEPGRVAAERYQRQQDILNRAYQSGAIDAARYEAAMKTLAEQHDRSHRSSGLLTQSTRELFSAFASFASVGAITNFLVEGARGALEEERALRQLSNVVSQFGHDGEDAARRAKALADALAMRGFDDEAVIKAVRDLTVQTRDYSQALSGASLAADLSAKTGKDYGESLALIQDLLAGKSRSVVTAHKEFGTTATTTQGALDEIQRRFGGYAQTLNDTKSRLDATKVQLQNFGETLGGPLAKATDYAIKVLKSFAQAIAGVGVAFVSAFTEVKAWIDAVTTMFRSFDVSRPFESLGAGAKEASRIMAAAADEVTAQWQQWSGDMKAIWTDQVITVNETARLISDPLEKATKDAGKKAGERYANDLVESTNAKIKATSTSDAVGDSLQEMLDRAAKKIKDIAPVKEIFKADAPAKQHVDVWASEMAKVFADTFAGGVQDAFVMLWTGGDAAEAWTRLGEEIGRLLGEAMGATINQGLFGGSGPLGSNVTGIFAGGWQDWSKAQRLQFAGQLIGAGLQYYGQQRQDATASALGGALSGALSGWQMGGGWGAVVGALVGGYMGWQGAQQKKTDYRLTYNPLTGRTDVDVTGYGQMEEDEMARQLYERQLFYRREFRALGRDLGLGNINISQALNLSRGGQAGSFADWWQAYLSGELPRTMWGAVSGQISSGLAGMGVGQGRIKELMDAFESGTFDSALSDLQAFVKALVGLRDVSDLLGLTPEELRAKVNATMREGFLQGFEDVMERMSELMDGVDQLFSQEQVRNAEELTKLAQTQYEAGLRYFAQLEQMRIGISQSFEDIFLGFEEERAREGGLLGQWYSQQMTGLLDQLRNASSAEQVQRLIQQLQRYGTSLWQMGDSVEGFAGGRMQVEEWLREAQRVADEKLRGWEEEVAAKNAELKAQLEAMIAALQGNSVSLTMSSDEVRNFGGAVDGAVDRLVDFTARVVQASDALGALANSAQAAAGWN